MTLNVKKPASGSFLTELPQSCDRKRTFGSGEALLFPLSPQLTAALMGLVAKSCEVSLLKVKTEVRVKEERR